MVTEPDNLVLQMLREILGTLAEHSRVLAEHSRAFIEIREELRGAHNSAAYAAGFAVLSRRDNDGRACHEARGSRATDRAETRELMTDFGV